MDSFLSHITLFYSVIDMDSLVDIFGTEEHAREVVGELGDFIFVLF